MNFLSDGGWFQDTMGNPLRVQFTQDGTNWFDVTGLDKGLYTNDYLSAAALGATSTYTGSWLFTFNPVSDVTGLRLIGLPGGSAGDMSNYGYLSIGEMQAFAVAVPEPGTSALLGGLASFLAVSIYRHRRRRACCRSGAESGVQRAVVGGLSSER
ncbi:MAG: PEP-CTERM sorting domain-containing protein [Opitutaceae bacterium]